MDTLNYYQVGNAVLKLDEEPYLSGDMNNQRFLARAYDRQENCWIVGWDIIDTENDDENTACDWKTLAFARRI